MTTPPVSRHRIRQPYWLRGVAAVEFVITAPLLIFLMLAVAEIGRVFLQYDTLSYSIRNSARFVTENAIDRTSGVVRLDGDVVDAAKNLAVFGNAAGTGRPVLKDFAVTQVTVAGVGNDNISVSAVYPYQPMLGRVLPLFGVSGGGSIPLSFNLRISVIMRAIS